MAKIGIYKITNLINSKVYIGSSSDLEKRKSNHFSKLRKGTHINKHLQGAYNLSTGEVFNSVAEAAYITGVKSPTNICQVCQGKRKTAGGFSWSYYKIEEKV